MKKDPKIYLEHIQEAIRAILEFTNDVTEEKFYQSDLLQSAVIRKFEIMGEAAKRLPKKLRDKNPDIPWKQMAGFRDILIHDYDDLNLEIIWETIRTDLPSILPLIDDLTERN